MEGLGVLAGLTVGSLLKCSALYYLAKRHNQRYERVATVSNLFIFPVKSCAGVSCEQIECRPDGACSGPAKDRHWLVIKAGTGRFVTARQEPGLTLVTPSFHGDDMHLDAPGQDTLKVPISLPNNSKVYSCIIWGQAVEGVDCGDMAAMWLCSYLNKPGRYRLVHASDRTPLREMFGVKESHENMSRPGDVVAYQDFSQFNLLTQESLDDLNSRLTPGTKIDPRSFRPNILVEGAQAFAEDSWSQVKVGPVVSMTKLKLTHRCVQTTLDPRTGSHYEDGEPLKTLRKYRKRPDIKGFGNSPCLSVNLALDTCGLIQVGDTVYATIGDNN